MKRFLLIALTLVMAVGLNLGCDSGTTGGGDTATDNVTMTCAKCNTDKDVAKGADAPDCCSGAMTPKQ